MKKTLLTSITALAMIMISAQAEAPKCGQGKCGAGMAKQAKHSKKKMHRKGMHSPFLIKHGLPHYTKILMKNWDDPRLGLTEEQKNKLLQVRKETIGTIKKLKPQIKALTQEIVKAAKEGTKASELQDKVNKLASLEAEATMTHLKCIEETKAILKPEQLNYLQMKKREKKMQHKAMMMKCQAGK